MFRIQSMQSGFSQNSIRYVPTKGCHPVFKSKMKKLPIYIENSFLNTIITKLLPLSWYYSSFLALLHPSFVQYV